MPSICRYTSIAIVRSTCGGHSSIMVMPKPRRVSTYQVSCRPDWASKEEAAENSCPVRVRTVFFPTRVILALQNNGGADVLRGKRRLRYVQEQARQGTGPGTDGRAYPARRPCPQPAERTPGRHQGIHGRHAQRRHRLCRDVVRPLSSDWEKNCTPCRGRLSRWTRGTSASRWTSRKSASRTRRDSTPTTGRTWPTSNGPARTTTAHMHMGRPKRRLRRATAPATKKVRRFRITSSAPADPAGSRSRP
jgi:hypothetical protein